MLGHPLEGSSAVDREQSARLRNGQRVEKVSKEDTRHLKLARLGLVLSGDPGADSLTPLELRRRDEAWTTKKEKLASSNFSVSETRLSVRNLPTFASESQLREHALSAAASVGGANTAPPVRFTKGKPGYRRKERIVKHVKIVRDDERVGANGEGRSRGFGFVEFETHEQARAALKAMSDKPMANLGERAANRRLLVEFAVDSVLKLKLHEERRRKGAEQREADGDAKSEGAAARRGPVPDRPILRTKRRAAEDEVALPAASYSGNAKHGPGTGERPQKRMRPQKPVGPPRGGGDKDLANVFEDSLDDMRHGGGGKSRRQAPTGGGKQEDARFDQLVDEYKRKIGATSMQKNISAWM
jgi:nucleolar protein 4